MAGKNDNSNGDPQDDGDLFRKAMAEIKVKPSKRPRNNLSSKPRSKPKPPVLKPAVPRPAIHRRKTPAAESAAGGVMTDKTNQGEYVEFARSGLQKKITRRLKRGDYDFTATLDLHGHTTAEAQKLLANFLLDAGESGDSAILIIHGKGLHSGGAGGVLKRFTLDWLKRQPEVKAFCSALPKDGGTGAVYVLLRRR